MDISLFFSLIKFLEIIFLIFFFFFFLAKLDDKFKVVGYVPEYRLHAINWEMVAPILSHAILFSIEMDACLSLSLTSLLPLSYLSLTSLLFFYLSLLFKITDISFFFFKAGNIMATDRLPDAENLKAIQKARER